MPVRGRGRGLRGQVPDAPVLSAEQRARLNLDHPPPASDQFEDAKESTSDESSVKTDTKSSESETVDVNQSSDQKDKQSPPPNPLTTQNTPPTSKPRSGSGFGFKPLNVDAPVFVPNQKLSSGGGASLEEPPPIYYAELSPDDVVNSFPHKSTADSVLLMSAATMLLEASAFPATFDTHLSILSHLIESTTPTDDILDDLAEMLVSWVSLVLLLTVYYYSHVGHW